MVKKTAWGVRLALARADQEICNYFVFVWSSDSNASMRLVESRSKLLFLVKSYCQNYLYVTCRQDWYTSGRYVRALTTCRCVCSEEGEASLPRRLRNSTRERYGKKKLTTHPFAFFCYDIVEE